MAKFQEAENRLFKNIFVCRKCKSRNRTTNLRVLAGKSSRRKCGSRAMKPVRKK